MRVAIYNRHWATLGGGEKYAGAMAQALRERHDVTLLAHGEVDLGELDERLVLDLAGLPVQQIGLAGRLREASSAYDLLVNASFESSEPNGAPRGIYIAYFPHHPQAAFSPRQRGLLRAAGPLLGARRPRWEPGPGFHQPDPLRASRIWWSDGDGELEASVPASRSVELHLLFANLMPPGTSCVATIEVDGEKAGSVRINGPGSLRSGLLPQVGTVRVVGHADGSPLRLRVRSDIHRSDYEDDSRDLGVPLMGVAMGRNPLGWLRAYASIFHSFPPSANFLKSYGLVLSISSFTQRWVQAYWGRDSHILSPPVTMRSASGPKEAVICSIGRFFPPERGHCKKQLEMVEAFGRLVRSGRASTWELHLVGGCAPADQPYLDAVRSAAEGLPVRFHIGATGEEVDSLYRRASIYWHATGYGEDAARHPGRMEHFGITPVEAMSAGAVPVAYGQAGPLEVFDDGVEGFHFHTLDRLVEATELLITQPERREEMSRAAVRRAQSFSMERFAERTNGYVDLVVNGPEHGR